MGSDPRDLDELQKALNDTARNTAVLWIAFITFLLYLAIAFGSVTHRDLLFATQVKLPVLNTDLPLVGFFVVAPVLLTVFHFYILLQLLALGAKADAYNKLLAQEALWDPWKIAVFHRFVDAIVVDVVACRFCAEDEVITNVLLDKAVSVMAADHRVG
jgi:hypothetical protein